MNKILAVIRREFIERVRTKSFLLGSFLLPLMIGLFGYLPQLLIRRDASTRELIVMNAAEGRVAAGVAEALRAARIGEGELVPPRYTVTLLPAEGRCPAGRDALPACAAG